MNKKLRSKIMNLVMCLFLLIPNVNIHAFAEPIGGIDQLSTSDTDDLDTAELVIVNSGVINDTVEWYVYDNGILEITGTGAVPPYKATDYAPWHEYASSITQIIVRDTITEIGGFAFAGCDSVVSITLPFVGKNRESTGGQAHFGYIFGYFTETTRVLASTGGPDYYSATRLYASDGESFVTRWTAVTREMYWYYFINGALNQEYATTAPWYTCKDGVYNYEGKKHYLQYQTYYYNVPETLKFVRITDATNLGVAAFNNCRNICKIRIDSVCESFSSYVFQGCSSLEDVVFQDGIITIESYAFNGCTSLSEIQLPKTVAEINEFAFANCNNLTKITLPFVGKSRNATGWQAHIGYIFGYTRKPASMPLGLGITVTLYTTDGASFKKKLNMAYGVVEGSTKFINGTPDSEYATAIPWYSCQDGSSGGYYLRLQTYYFDVPTALKTVVITDSEKIGEAAFNNCRYITDVSLNDRLNQIEAYSFQGCVSLNKIDVLCTSMIDETAFSDCDILVEKNMRHEFGEWQNTKDPTWTESGEKFRQCSLCDVVDKDSIPKLSEGHTHDFTGAEEVFLEATCTRDGTKKIYCSEPLCGEYTTVTIPAHGHDPLAPVSENVKGSTLFEEGSYEEVVYCASCKEELSRTSHTIPVLIPSEDKDITVTVGDSLDMSSYGLDGYNWETLNKKIARINQNEISFVKTGRTNLIGSTESGYALVRLNVEFKDVRKEPKKPYYYDPVYWAVENNITVGIKNSKSGLYENFNPQGECTRAQMIAFLWRMAGQPEPSQGISKFTDISPTDYYYKAVLWGTQNGIVGGYSDNTFRPQGKCTRSQAVSFLWRYYGTPEPTAVSSPFSDNQNPKAYYYKAVLWASENSITGGYSDGTFRPSGNCTRAQMVSFLYRCRTIQ